MSVIGCIGDFGEEEIGGKETWMLRRNVKRAPTAHKQPPAEFVTIAISNHENQLQHSSLQKYAGRPHQTHHKT